MENKIIIITPNSLNLNIKEMKNKPIGQLTNSEFKNFLIGKTHNVDFINGTAWVKYGKSTINYYMQMVDNSWTNYDCKTI